MCSAPSAEVGPRRLFFGRFDMVKLVGQSGHLIILIGCSAGKPVHEKGAERTCYFAVGCRASAWCVRATLDPDVSRPRSLLSSPLVSSVSAWCVPGLKLIPLLFLLPLFPLPSNPKIVFVIFNAEEITWHFNTHFCEKFFSHRCVYGGFEACKERNE